MIYHTEEILVIQKKIMMLKVIAYILAIATVRVIGGDYLLYDIGALVKVNLTGREESKRVVVIEIDDETLENIHQYPLARHYYLSALRNIKNSSLVIIDILFQDGVFLPFPVQYLPSFYTKKCIAYNLV